MVTPTQTGARQTVATWTEQPPCPCSRPGRRRPSGSTPTATATPRPCWTPRRVQATLQVPSDQAGHARLLRLADTQAPGRRMWALEGTGCYGAGLTRFLVDRGEGWTVIDRPQPPPGQERPLGRRPGRPRGPGPRPPHQPLPARAPRGAAGAAPHPGRHRGRRSRCPPPAQGPDRHRPGAAAGQLGGGGPGASRSTPAPGWRLCLGIRWSTGPPCGRSALTAQRVLAARREAKQLEAELRQLVTVVAPACSASPGSAPSPPHHRCPAADQLVPAWPVPL
jgi:transposase